MSWLDFFASLASSLSWPAAIAVIAWWLKPSIRGLIDRIYHVRWGDKEADLAHDLSEQLSDPAQLWVQDLERQWQVEVDADPAEGEAIVRLPEGLYTTALLASFCAMSYLTEDEEEQDDEDATLRHLFAKFYQVMYAKDRVTFLSSSMRRTLEQGWHVAQMQLVDTKDETDEN